MQKRWKKGCLTELNIVNNHHSKKQGIDETAFRIYSPKVPDTDSMIPINSASSAGHSTFTTLICQDEAIVTQGPPLLLFAHSPSLPTMFTRVYLAKFC